MINNSCETITAIATPSGFAGLSVIRLSGDRSFDIIDKIFKGTSQLISAESHTAHYGWIEDNGFKIDEVIVTLFRRPHSYTGEDVVEIGCHGGAYVTRTILDIIISKGVKPAEPGEFTFRAYANGRIDLAQAEAVADLVHAKTEAARRVAVSQLHGGLSVKLNKIRDKLVEICSLLEIELDFIEEDIAFAGREDLISRIDDAAAYAEKLLKTFNRGRVCREGVRLILWGKPNVGKSSLLNAIVEKERAIVTDIPGTTRDTIEDVLDINGLCFTVIDTAGMRQSTDHVEMEGLKRAQGALEAADIILLVFDSSQDLDPEDEEVIRSAARQGKPMLTILNKADLPERVPVKKLTGLLPEIKAISVSALKGSGIENLAAEMEKIALADGMPSSDDVVITKARHAVALTSLRDHLQEAAAAIDSGLSQEFIAADLRLAIEALEEITGHSVNEEVLNKIFSEFCIGK